MALRCRIKPYIQPFERLLAFEELRILAGNTPIPVDGPPSSADYFLVTTTTPANDLAARLAYWEAVGPDEVVSAQAKRESTVNVVRNGIDLAELESLLPFGASIPLPNRRCLRYGTHGIHEYRGKFFPQLVRALLNIAETPQRGWVLDPMSGSGTTVTEARLAGHNAIGLDLNPLSAFIARTKADLLTVTPELLASAYRTLRERLLLGRPQKRSGIRPYFDALPVADQRYLSAWFSEDVLDSLDEIACAIENTALAGCRNLMWVSLSNVLRRVSWQKEDDLRVRKEIRLDKEIDPIREFLEELGRSVRAVLALRYQEGTTGLGTVDVRQGDARASHLTWPELEGKIDAVVTSPPYATALPYLDTDRLSLCYLGLLTRPEHRKFDYSMIGNREITESIRRSLWCDFLNGKHNLPPSIASLIHSIEAKNRSANVGFRRRNLPALLFKYFIDMGDVLGSTYRMLRPGAFAFFVVGSNHTIAGGTRVDIQTGSLLSDLAKLVGFQLYEPISMEMLVSRDIFKKNASDREDILVFRKPT